MRIVNARISNKDKLKLVKMFEAKHNPFLK